MPLPNCTCEVCGASFHRYPAWIKRGGGTTCSIECRNIRARAAQDQGGANNPAYRHGRARGSERLRAWRLVYKALAAGKLSRPTVCSACTKAGELHGHHADYDKPLEVEWLCRECHNAAHREAA